MSNNIKALRNKAGLTQKDLSEQANIPRRTIEDWELEKVRATDVYKLHRIAKVLGCTIEDLINFEDEEKPE